MSMFNFSIDQGSTNVVEFIITENGSPFDLTDYTAQLMARRTYGAGVTVINATTANGKLAINIPAGKITMSLQPSDTSGITYSTATEESIEVVYDLEITHSGGQVYKPVRGTITINREVTRT